MKVIGAHLHRQDITTFVYLVDWLVVGQSEAEARSAMSMTLDLMSSLGFIDKEEKSRPKPTRLPIFSASRGGSPTISRLGGEPTAICPTFSTENISHSPCLATSPWAHDQYGGPSAALASFLSTKATLVGSHDPIPCHIHPRLRWWHQEANVASGLSFRQRRPSVIIMTDALLTGWGQRCPHDRCAAYGKRTYDPFTSTC